MSGIHQLLLAGGRDTYLVTIDYSLIAGYSRSGPVLGSMSPDSYNGLNFQEVFSRGGSVDFQVALLSGVNPGATFFNQIVVQDESGVNQTFLSSGAVYSYGAGKAIWGWGTGGSPVWTIASVGITRPMRVT